MTREEILENGVYIVLPNSSDSYREYDIDAIKMPLGERYVEWSMNRHHFTTKYHREKLMPVLAELLHFNFDTSKYHMVEATSDGFDVSQLYPNDGTLSFNLWCISDGEKLNKVPYGKIVENNYTTSDITGFHRLFRYSHKSSVITNNKGGNGKTLFISGDSNIIPSVPTLCTIFKEVWYIDNRVDDVEIYKHLKDVHFDEILFELNWNNLDHYTTKNLK